MGQSVHMKSLLIVVIMGCFFSTAACDNSEKPARSVSNPQATTSKLPTPRSVEPQDSSGAATSTAENISSWTPEQRAERMRKECRADGYCASGWVFKLLNGAKDDAERRGLTSLCLDAKNGAVAKARDALGELQKLERAARSGCSEGAPGNTSAVDTVRESLNRLDGNAPGVVLLRIAAGNVRQCTICSSGSTEACDDARASFSEIKKELAEPQEQYCKL